MIIIDIRENYEYKISHINDAINIPYNMLKLAPEKYLDKNNTYYLYCDKGIYSDELSILLNNKGYKTKSIKGGYEKYKLNNIL